MSVTRLDAFDAGVQTSNIWLKDVMAELGWTDRHKACRAMRDRLPADEADEGQLHGLWQPQRLHILVERALAQEGQPNQRHACQLVLSAFLTVLLRNGIKIRHETTRLVDWRGLEPL